MFLHKALMPCNATFFAMDVACKYWPYLQKAANHLPELLELLNSTPLRSVMHAQNHETKCQVSNDVFMCTGIEMAIDFVSGVSVEMVSVLKCHVVIFVDCLEWKIH